MKKLLGLIAIATLSLANVSFADDTMTTSTDSTMTTQTETVKPAATTTKTKKRIKHSCSRCNCDKKHGVKATQLSKND